jgi:hypothetical protein
VIARRRVWSLKAGSFTPFDRPIVAAFNYSSDLVLIQAYLFSKQKANSMADAPQAELA